MSQQSFRDWLRQQVNYAAVVLEADERHPGREVLVAHARGRHAAFTEVLAEWDRREEHKPEKHP